MILLNRLVVELLHGLKLHAIDPEVMQVELRALDPLSQTGESPAFLGRSLDRRMGDEIAHMSFHHDEVVPSRRLKTPVALPDPGPVEHDPGTVMVQHGERVGIEHGHHRIESARTLAHAIDLIPIKPAVKIAAQCDFPNARLTIGVGPSNQRLLLRLRSLRQVGTEMQGNAAGPRGKKPEYRLFAPHDRPQRQIGFEVEKKAAGSNRDRINPRTIGPRDRVGFGQIQRLAQRKPPQVPPSALRIDDSVEITGSVDEGVGRIVGQPEPLVLSRHKFKPLAGRIQQILGRPGPKQHVFTVETPRLKPPLLASHRRLPAVEIARDVNRIALRINFRAVPRREGEDKLAGGLHKITVSHGRHQPGVHRQPRWRRTLVAKRELRRPRTPPVAIQFDHARDGRFEPSPDDTVRRFSHVEAKAFAGPTVAQAEIPARQLRRVHLTTHRAAASSSKRSKKWRPPKKSSSRFRAEWTAPSPPSCSNGKATTSPGPT